MRKPRNTSELMHHWANRVDSSGQCGNLRYSGDVLFSYREPIARLVGQDTVLVSDSKFSVTTSRHQSEARSATNNRRALFVPEVPEYQLEEGHTQNLKAWEGRFLSKVALIKSHPRRKSLLGELERIKNTHKEYSDVFGLEWPELNTEALAARREEARQIEAERREREAIEAEKAKKKRIQEQAALLDLWRNHDPGVQARWFEVTALRLSLDKQEIETSKGARVSVEVAPFLWKEACGLRHKQVSREFRIPVGHYILDRIKDDGSLIVGCHEIPFSELEGIAGQLGFAPYTEEVTHFPLPTA